MAFLEEGFKSKPPEVVAKIRAKMARKAKEHKQVSHKIAICVKKVPRLNGDFMPVWEEKAAVAMAVQNMHLYLTANGPYCGYWSSGGVDSFLNCPEMRELMGTTEEGDMCLGYFLLGATDKFGKMKAKRGAMNKKTKWVA